MHFSGASESAETQRKVCPSEREKSQGPEIVKNGAPISRGDGNSGAPREEELDVANYDGTCRTMEIKIEGNMGLQIVECRIRGSGEIRARDC
jgi:hypothetical protein